MTKITFFQLMCKRRKLTGEMAVSSGLAAESKIQEILDTARQHDNSKLERLLKAYKFKDVDAVDVQDAHGTSPLHAAILGNSSHANGESASEDSDAAGYETVRLLLESGAIWNQLDENNETPGCIAFRLGLLNVYEIMVDAGTRAEILLNRLEEYERLEDSDAEEAGQENGTVENESPDAASKSEQVPDLVDSAAIEQSANTGVPAKDVNSADYLASDLVLTRNKLLDKDKNGVMMGWESGIMKDSVDLLLTKPDMRILNIGAGMMIFDTFVQNHPNKPQIHHIVEAHPDILTNMENEGWDSKPGVTVHPGRWQEILPQLVAENQTFDAIYYDTFAESYSDFREFFTEYVLGLLESDGRWSFFNGMGADRQISYDVYQKVAEIDLMEAGFDVEWHSMEIPDLGDQWDGVKRKYWNVKQYRLPVCKFMD